MFLRQIPPPFSSRCDAEDHNIIIIYTLHYRLVTHMLHTRTHSFGPVLLYSLRLYQCKVMMWDWENDQQQGTTTMLVVVDGYGRNIKVGIRWVCKSSVLHWKTHQWTKTWPPRSRAAWMKSLLCETYCIKSCLGESAALIIKYFLSCKVNWSFSLVCSVKNNLSNS